MAEFGGWEKEGAAKAVRTGVDRVAGPDSGGYVRFRLASPSQVRMKVAISYVSEENARRNLDAELPGWDFDATARASADEWNRWLSTITVAGGTEAQRVKFYTTCGTRCSAGGPSRTSMAGTWTTRDPGRASGRCRSTPRAPDARHLQQRFVLGFAMEPQRVVVVCLPARHERADRIAGRLLHERRHDGSRPAGGNYSFVMIGDRRRRSSRLPTTRAFATSTSRRPMPARGRTPFLAAFAIGRIRVRAEPAGRRDAGLRRARLIRAVPGTKGFHRAGAAQTLEYAYQDWCLAQFAKGLGRQDDYALFMKRSSNWMNLFDPSVAGSGEEPRRHVARAVHATCTGAPAPGSSSRTRPSTRTSSRTISRDWCAPSALRGLH